MKARAAFFILLGAGLLAAAQRGVAQSTPSYRPPPSSPQYRPPAQPPASAPEPPPSTTPVPASSTSPGPITPVTSKIIQSVSIQNSPGVPDTGGHCIICGLVTGNLSAVEPNLVICLTPTGGSAGRRTCSDICSPGHNCKKVLGDGVRINGTTSSVHVEVLDNDKDGKIQLLAAFDENDATQCTTAQPCKVNDADDQGAGTLVSFELANAAPEGCAAPTSGSSTGSNLVTSSMTVSGKLPPVTLTCAEEAPVCHGPYASVDAAVMMDSYGPQALQGTVGEAKHGISTEYGFVIVRDSSQHSGGYYATPPVRSSERSLLGTSLVSIADYQKSLSEASCGTIQLSSNASATVHTHPTLPSSNQNFTASDFTQAIQLLNLFPQDFEKIVMIYAGDRMVRTFVPAKKDPNPAFTSAQILFLNSDPSDSVASLTGAEKVKQQWERYVARTQLLTTYP